MLPPALSGPSATAVASLSRAFAKEIENLPTRYLRTFYKIKVKDDIEALPNPESPNFKARYRRVSRELRKLEAANNGNSAAYQHILSLAYGRKGKLRRELMEPLLSDPSAPLPPPIIPSLESSRPPVYSPEMTALLVSELSRHGSSPRTQKQLQNPPTLPPRADPESSDAKILGPLSKRREVNLRWRFFEGETARVQVPIEVSRVHISQASESHDKPRETNTLEGAKVGDAGQPRPPSVGFQGTTVLRDLEVIASPNRNQPLQNATNDPVSASAVNHFIRRQHRKILRKIPILTYCSHPSSPAGKYEVSLSPLVDSSLLKRLPSVVPMAEEADIAWLTLPPPQKPKPQRGSPVKVEPMTEKQKPDRDPRVDEKLKHESNPVNCVGPHPTKADMGHGQALPQPERKVHPRPSK